MGIITQLNADKTTRGPVIVEAGRRVDAVDATAARFPSQSVVKVRKRIRQVLTEQQPVATVSCAACGADLLLDVAMELGVTSHVTPGIQMRTKGHNEIKLFWHEGQIGEAQLRRIGT